MIEKLIMVLVARFLLLFRGSKPTGKFDAVSDFDLDRFLGTWYVACYVPQPFTRRLSSTSTSYSKNTDGTITLTDRGYSARKKQWSTEEAVATLEKSETIGWFSVDASNPLARQRKIIYLDEDYTQAIVVGVTMRTLWIVGRDLDLALRDLDSLIDRADRLGFKTRKLMRVDQSQNADSGSHH